MLIFSRKQLEHTFIRSSILRYIQVANSIFSALKSFSPDYGYFPLDLNTLFLFLPLFAFSHHVQLPTGIAIRKLKDSLGRVLLAAGLEFPIILVLTLPQHTSNVNIECARKSEQSNQQCSLHVTRFSRSITVPELNTGGKYCCSMTVLQYDSIV